MGLFILPGRLYNESQMINDILTGKQKLNFQEIADESHPLNKHLGMIAQLTNDNGLNMNDSDANEVIMDYINKSTEKILKCTAVFKNNEEGQAAFRNLIDAMSFYSN